MKQHLLLVLAGFLTAAAHAQTHVPDADSMPPSTSHLYYENRGQVIDDTGGLHSEIKYYTDLTSPAMYLADGKVSFQMRQQTADTVSTYRIDMEFVCPGDNPCGAISAYEPGGDHINYYLPHCGAEGIAGVPGMAGVVYEHAFQNIDVHFYSNGAGPLAYFVFNPGANPDDLKLRFSGVDSIVATAGFLEGYLGPMGLSFGQSTAYQVDGSGNIHPLSWLPVWKATGNDVSMAFGGPFNPAWSVVVRAGRPFARGTGATDNLVWATFYGGNGTEGRLNDTFVTEGLPIVEANSTGNTVYHAMTTTSTSTSNLPTHLGSSTNIISNNKGAYDCYLSRFDSSGRRIWSTYYGGTMDDEPTALKYLQGQDSNPYGNLLLAGRTHSQNLPLGKITPSFFKDSLSNRPATIGSFLAGFYDSSGELTYTTYYGNGYLTYILDLDYDNVGGEILFCGTNTWWQDSMKYYVDSNSNRPHPNSLSLKRGTGSRYFQANDVDGRTALVGKFGVNNRDLIWATMVGGTGHDAFTKIVHDRTTGHHGIYVLGNSSSQDLDNIHTSPRTTNNPSSNSMPLSNFSGSYFQNTGALVGFGAIPPHYGCITHFDENDAIDWCTFFGASGDEYYTGAAINSAGDLYITGCTRGGNPSTSGLAQANSLHRLPVYAATGSYSQDPGNHTFISNNTDTDAVIARFDAANHALTWCTYFGQRGEEFNPTFVVVDNADNVFISGNNRIDVGSTTAQSIHAVSVPGRYNQAQNASTGLSDAHPDAADGWIAHFSPTNALIWATHYGGLFNLPHASGTTPREEITSISLGARGSDVRLYMTGLTGNWLTPTKGRCPNPSSSFCDTVYDALGDAFIGKFANARLTGLLGIASNATGSILVRPNPSTGIFYINYINATGTATSGRVTAYNIMGQAVQSRTISLTHGQNEFSLDLHEFPAGTYLLQISAGGTIESAKLSKY